MPPTRGFSPIVLIIIVVLLGLGGAGYYISQKVVAPVESPINEEPVACTQEAKQCPDGSYVGRVGPNCDFAPCPSEGPNMSTPGVDTSNWQTYRNEEYGFEFRYPDQLDLSITPTGSIQIIRSEDKNKDFAKAGLWFRVEENLPNINLTDWWNKNKFDNADSFESPLPITLDGIGGFEINSKPGSFPETHILLSHNNKIIDIMQNLGLEAEQIISTLRFIK